MLRRNKFILKEGDKLEKVSRDEIFLQAGCESVVYVEHGDMCKYIQEKDEFTIGAFVHSPFWLNQNQINFIHVRMQSPAKSVKINKVLDQVLI